MKKGLIIAIISTLLIGIGAFIFINNSSNNITGELVSAPHFVVKNIDGNRISLEENLNGKPVVIQFFATWCPYCKQDFEALKTVYPEYKDKIEVIAVDLDLKENADIINKYKTDGGYQWTFAQGNREVLLAYDVTATTKKVAISKSGKIIWIGSGPIDSQNWKKLLEGTIQSE